MSKQKTVTAQIKSVNQLVDIIVKTEKLKHSIAYIAGMIYAHSISAIYFDAMKKDEIINDLRKCIMIVGLERSIKVLNGVSGKRYDLIIAFD